MPIWHYHPHVLVPIWHYQPHVKPLDGAKMALKTPVSGKNDSAKMAHIYNILPKVGIKKQVSRLGAADKGGVQCTTEFVHTAKAIWILANAAIARYTP